ncbi:hypothetical protein DAPPUDRAFT_270916 [Daphnia pulex]|uniref:Uncharacterized protein n=1 Tax=Daphnia pulex TaxID=6669 RepID=E9I1H8_DAPPU|nr:hypothetical protein DAPPUDRAFT_270916 [Daphnia pulex]|eukprot:EFX62152.1 hypothetical protein DAPPUDRAFT_270916 [Daphnia pulex]
MFENHLVWKHARTGRNVSQPAQEQQAPLNSTEADLSSSWTQLTQIIDQSTVTRRLALLYDFDLVLNNNPDNVLTHLFKGTPSTSCSAASFEYAEYVLKLRVPSPNESAKDIKVYAGVKGINVPVLNFVSILLPPKIHKV